MVSSIEVTIPQPVYEVARDDNITLPCSFKPKSPVTKTTNVIVSWSASPDLEDDPESLRLLVPSLITTHYHSLTSSLDVKSEYEGRVTLDHDITRGKINLKLQKVSMRDTRLHECKVQIPLDDEGNPSDTTDLVVLVAPSKPICKIQGTAEYGNNVNLTCFSEEGSPKPIYKWKNYDTNNNPLPSLPLKATEKDGVLSLFNISRETSGYFICTSTNKIRSASCNVTLSVMPRSLMSTATTAIIASVGAIAVLILAVIIYCCCCRKKKNKGEEYAMGEQEDVEYTDKEHHENGDGYVDRHDRQDERSEKERDYSDRRSDYHDQRSDYDDRRSDYNDRRSDYDDRRSDHDDRRDRYPDRRDDYDDRRERYDDRRDHYDDRYDDRRDRYDDRRDNRRDRHDNRRDRYDDRYDDPDRPPSVPPNKPSPGEYRD
ncbi:glycoprotein A33 (transmembrane), paralog a [Chanos chanos]|uniref:Glycoprotein A33 (Transmembrane), paralog a n=1 Tax=Chanos chanos TaxID=29144 RepID=A0A6J2VT21_CHACN|nr:cell surface A33 antigen-like [Chanos chanos]